MYHRDIGQVEVGLYYYYYYNEIIYVVWTDITELLVISFVLIEGFPKLLAQGFF